MRHKSKGSEKRNSQYFPGKILEQIIKVKQLGLQLLTSPPTPVKTDTVITLLSLTVLHTSSTSYLTAAAQGLHQPALTLSIVVFKHFKLKLT